MKSLIYALAEKAERLAAHDADWGREIANLVFRSERSSIAFSHKQDGRPDKGRQGGLDDGKNQYQKCPFGTQRSRGPVSGLEIALRQREQEHEQNAHRCKNTDATSRQRRQHKQSMNQS